MIVPLLKTLLSFVKDVATLVVSISALIVAYNSFSLSEKSFKTMSDFQTYDRTQRERAYNRDEEAREQAIQPKLNFSWNRSDIELSMNNLGLGPAIIKSYQMFGNNKYITSLTSYNYLEYTTLLSEILGLNDADLRIDGGHRFDTQTYMFGADAIIDKGKDVAIFNVNYDGYKDAFEKATPQLREQLLSRRKSISEKFERGLSTASIAFCYCSLTEKICAVYSSAEDKNYASECKSKERRP